MESASADLEILGSNMMAEMDENSNQNQMNPTRLSAFEEDLLLMNGQQALAVSEQEAINQVLANNGAVGVIAGYYEEGLPIAFASYYFLRSLGYDYTEYKAYDPTRGHNLRDLVYEEDRGLFELTPFRAVQGRCDFRIVDRDGVPFYANGYKMECTDMDGRLQWILSIRISTESIDQTLANNAERARDKAEAQTRRIEMESMQALRDALDAANRANEAKTEFLAHMSHDLRTPLNGIIGMTALAGAHIDDRERVLDSLDKIHSASQHLLGLVNELLDMSASVSHGAQVACETTAETLTQMQEQDYSDRRFLLVEDNELNREIAIEMVGMTGAAIETAVNGQEAVDLFTAAPDGYYDMILMDIQMPVMDGYEAARTIRALPDGRGQTIPIVAMTANAFAEDVVRARNAGFNDHLAKPISISRLRDILREQLQA